MLDDEIYISLVNDDPDGYNFGEELEPGVFMRTTKVTLNTRFAEDFAIGSLIDYADFLEI